jgi:hypothetical protein
VCVCGGGGGGVIAQFVADGAAMLGRARTADRRGNLRRGGEGAERAGGGQVGGVLESCAVEKLKPAGGSACLRSGSWKQAQREKRWARGGCRADVDAHSVKRCDGSIRLLLRFKRDEGTAPANFVMFHGREVRGCGRKMMVGGRKMMVGGAKDDGGGRRRETR